MAQAMHVEDEKPLSPLERIWREIRTHGLETHVAELDSQGYTVIPPKLACPGNLDERLLQACLDVAERRNGERPDLETGKTHENYKGRFAALLGENHDSPIGDLMQSLIFEDPVFEEALMNPILLTLASYLCGYSVVLSSMGCFMKGPNKSSFTLHSDTPMPSPLPPHSMVCNLTYVLTEFNKDSGSTAFVPGSHKWCRSPEANEADPDLNSKAVAVEAPAGSLLVWHGNTWHGAFNRTKPGLRVSIPVYMARPSVRTQEGLFGAVPDEMLERNEPRFGWLLQQGEAYGWKSQKDAIARSERAAKYAKTISDLTGERGFGNSSLYG